MLVVLCIDLAITGLSSDLYISEHLLAHVSVVQLSLRSCESQGFLRPPPPPPLNSPSLILLKWIFSTQTGGTPTARDQFFRLL